MGEVWYGQNNSIPGIDIYHTGSRGQNTTDIDYMNTRQINTVQILVVVVVRLN